MQLCKALEFGVRCPAMADGQQEVRKEGGREGGLWWEGLCLPKGLWSCFCAGRRGGWGSGSSSWSKERHFGSAVPGADRKKAERQQGAFNVLMCSMLLCIFCSSKAEGHLRLRSALGLGQYRNCLIFPQSIDGSINQLGFCLRGRILLRAQLVLQRYRAWFGSCRNEVTQNLWHLGSAITVSVLMPTPIPCNSIFFLKKKKLLVGLLRQVGCSDKMVETGPDILSYGQVGCYGV